MTQEQKKLLKIVIKQTSEYDEETETLKQVLIIQLSSLLTISFF
jgi:hypothetical protein